MKVIGLDQSTRRSAYSVFINGKLKRFGTFVADEKEKDPYVRMEQMHEQLSAFLKKEKPDAVVIENIQFQKNQHAYAVLGNMQGVVFAILYALHIPFFVVEPSKWRVNVGIKPTSKREILKKDAIETASAKYGIDASEDESEAALIGQWLVDMINTKQIILERNNKNGGI